MSEEKSCRTCVNNSGFGLSVKTNGGAVPISICTKGLVRVYEFGKKQPIFGCKSWEAVPEKQKCEVCENSKWVWIGEETFNNFTLKCKKCGRIVN